MRERALGEVLAKSCMCDGNFECDNGKPSLQVAVPPNKTPFEFQCVRCVILGRSPRSARLWSSDQSCHDERRWDVARKQNMRRSHSNTGASCRCMAYWRQRRILSLITSDTARHEAEEMSRDTSPKRCHRVCWSCFQLATDKLSGVCSR
jgi:hypothetical protein